MRKEMFDQELLATCCRKGLSAMEIDISSLQITQLVNYLELLWRWNKVHNLTNVSDPVEMVARHILDSATLLPMLQGKSLVDVGTGAGLPGIPLKILQPSLEVTLVECSNKRVNFLKKVIRDLKLSKIDVLAQRVEDIQISTPFDIVVSRAFAKMPKLLQLVAHLCDNHSVILAMKGDKGSEEAEQIIDGFKLNACLETTVPGQDWHHTVLVINKK